MSTQTKRSNSVMSYNLAAQKARALITWTALMGSLCVFGGGSKICPYLPLSVVKVSTCPHVHEKTRAWKFSLWVYPPGYFVWDTPYRCSHFWPTVNVEHLIVLRVVSVLWELSRSHDVRVNIMWCLDAALQTIVRTKYWLLSDPIPMPNAWCLRVIHKNL